MIPMHAPGIYFGLSDADYHADPALGSTGMKRLLASPPDFWWQSPLNPAREPEEDTPAKFFGRALHRCVLEGRERFLAEYGVAPSPDEYPDALVTADQLKDFLREAGEKVGGSKADLIERAEALPGCPPIFDHIVSGFADSGLLPLKRADYNRILAADAFIKANPYLAGAFLNGMPEVSVFWEQDGVRVKARFDYLKMNAIVDLKSIRNNRGEDFARACINAIANFHYTLSAGHYCEGRRQMEQLIYDGAVYGDHDPAWLRRVAANETFAFVLVFWQASGSPISKGFQLSPGNPLLTSAADAIRMAIDTYKAFSEQFGTEAAWMLEEPLAELDPSEMPAWWSKTFFTGA